jgi:hypothetical protein
MSDHEKIKLEESTNDNVDNALSRNELHKLYDKIVQQSSQFGKSINYKATNNIHIKKLNI